MRMAYPLNDEWQFEIISPQGTPIPADKQIVTLPHTWSSSENARRSIGRYTRELPHLPMVPDTRVWLQCDGAAMSAAVWLNGKKLMHHEGGYSTFRVDLTDYLAETNTLTIVVDNGVNQTVYPQNADFTFYGGLYRGVKLLVVPHVHFALGHFGAPGIRVTPDVNLDTGTAAVTVETWIEGKDAENETVTFSVDGQDRTMPVANGYAKAEFTLKNAHLWSGLSDPYLYTARATLSSEDEISTRFGCRKFIIDPDKGFLLNGSPYPLRGVSLHQDRADVGSALRAEHHIENMEIIRELGANTLRMAHYQHAQEFYDLCDENGLVVWTEIPYITRHMPSGRANTLTQMEELIVQNYNHACIAVWGISNEITAASTVNEDMMENHCLLHDLCRRLDPTRPTAMANVYFLDQANPLLTVPEVNSYNLYFGWYLGEPKQAGEFLDAYHAQFPNRPIGFSEYGADANPQFQSAAPKRGDYTEGYQALYHERVWQVIADRPYLWATHVWNLFDFGADGRDEGGKRAQNQKGLVTFDRKIKKDAFYFYKAIWNKTDPFVHLCGRRYAERTEKTTEIKVYSNLPEVTLFVDDKQVASKTGEAVFTFSIPLSGTHKIEARAGRCSDKMMIRQVVEPNIHYVYEKKKGIVNWFDQTPNDPACFSIGDTVAVLQADPRAAAVVKKLLGKAAAAMGQSETDDKAETDMASMNRVTLQNLLKFTGDAISQDELMQANRVLQGIKKHP